jgi:hypothetical protein
MLYKRKQIYWIDIVYKDKRLKECTGSKSKKKAEEYASRLIRHLMIEDRLGSKTLANFLDRKAKLYE